MSSPQGDAHDRARQLDIDLERDLFLRSLLRELAGTLEEVVGLEEASGFISIVGDRIGQMIGAQYREALDADTFDEETLAAVLVDLKRRIEGDFYVISVTEDEIVLGNRACPFGDKVLDRPSLCMMTSNVFGSIAADSFGYARVDLQETIAAGDGGCRVVVSLDPAAAGSAASGREYYAPR